MLTKNKLLLYIWLIVDVTLLLLAGWPFSEESSGHPSIGIDASDALFGIVPIMTVIFFLRFRGALSIFLKWISIYSGFHLIPSFIILREWECYPDVTFLECQEKSIVIAIFILIVLLICYLLASLVMELARWIKRARDQFLQNNIPKSK